MQEALYDVRIKRGIINGLKVTIYHRFDSYLKFTEADGNYYVTGVNDTALLMKIIRLMAPESQIFISNWVIAQKELNYNYWKKVDDVNPKIPGFRGQAVVYRCVHPAVQ